MKIFFNKYIISDLNNLKYIYGDLLYKFGTYIYIYFCTYFCIYFCTYFCSYFGTYFGTYFCKKQKPLILPHITLNL
jgi:hypothetical protein